MLSQLLLGLLATGLSLASPLAVQPHHQSRSQEGDDGDRQPPTLKPSVKWDRLLDDWQDLIPQTAQQLYYGSNDPTEKHQFADVAVNFTGRAVVLQHSIFVKEVECLGTTIEVKLSSKEAFAMVKDEWSSAADFMLVTNSETCGELTEELSFWDVLSLEFVGDSWTVRASVDLEHDMASVLDSVIVDWGTWEPAPPRVLSHLFAENQELAEHGQLIEKRFIRKLFKAAVNTVKFVGRVALEVAVLPFRFIPGTPLSTWKPALELSIPIEVAPDASKVDTSAPAPSHWVKPVPLFKVQKGKTVKGVEMEGNLGLYCVDCYFRGKIEVQGHAEFSPYGVKAMRVAANADFQSQFVLGIAADGKVEYKDEYELKRAAIPKVGVHVKGIITVGAFVDSRVKYAASIEAKGDVQAGVRMTSCKFNTELDLWDPRKSVRPTLEPVFERVFDASVEVTLQAGISFPIAIGFGVEIPALPDKIGKWTVSLVEEPGVNAEATFKASTLPKDDDKEGEKGGDKSGDGSQPEVGDEHGEDEAGEEDWDNGTGDQEDEHQDEDEGDPFDDFDPSLEERSVRSRGLVATRQEKKKEDECDGGIDWKIRFLNTIYLDAFGKYQHKLHEYNKTLAGGCFRLGGKQARSLGSRNLEEDEVWDEEEEYEHVNDWENDWDAEDYKELQDLSEQAVDLVEESDLDYEDFPEGTEFLMVNDISGKYQLTQDVNGFLVPGQAKKEPHPGAVWAEVDGYLFGDYNDRQFSFNPVMMRRNGYSSIWLAGVGVDVPDKDFVGLVPYATGNRGRPWIYSAMTTTGQNYALLTCAYSGKIGSRIFLARDIAAATKWLKLANPRSVGGRITNCVAQAWIVAPESAKRWA